MARTCNANIYNLLDGWVRIDRKVATLASPAPSPITVPYWVGLKPNQLPNPCRLIPQPTPRRHRPLTKLVGLTSPPPARTRNNCPRPEHSFHLSWVDSQLSKIVAQKKKDSSSASWADITWTELDWTWPRFVEMIELPVYLVQLSYNSTSSVILTSILVWLSLSLLIYLAFYFDHGTIAFDLMIDWYVSSNYCPSRWSYLGDTTVQV